MMPRDTMGRKWITRKFRRVRRRSGIKLSDLQRAFDWYLGGGRIFFERYYPELSRAHKWCFIVGCNNSGTSLLQSILERTDQISTLPTEGQLYTTVLARSNRRRHGRIWSGYLDDLQMSAADGIECAPRLLHDWMRDLRAPIQEIIIEKTPANTVRMEWLQKAFPRSYFIGLVRNGYAVAEGMRRKNHNPVDEGARHWNLVNEILIQQTTHVENYLEIRYEDLTDNPRRTAEQLVRFLKLSFDGLGAAIGGRFTSETIVGATPQPIRNMNGESIVSLSSADIKKIRANATRMLDYFDYETPSEIRKRAKAS